MRMNPFKGSSHILLFNDLDLVEREIFSLSLLGFRISSYFKSDSQSRFYVLCFSFLLLLFIPSLELIIESMNSSMLQTVI